MNENLKVGIVGALTFAPFLAFAETLGGILNTVNQLVGTATPIVVALALVYFFWGLANFILGSSESEGRKDAIQIMIYGIIALFIMVSIWGIVNVLQSTFNVGGNPSIPAPRVQGV
jgi:ABC-type glucose/galactose transport system permease subunit